MEWKILAMFIFIFSLPKTIEATGNILYNNQGTYNIAALVYYYGSVPNQPKCSQVRPSDGVLPLMGLIHAVNAANHLPQVKRKNFTMGLIVWDICDEETFQDTVIQIFYTAQFIGVIGTNNADHFTLLGVTMNLYFRPVWSLNEIPLDIDRRPRFTNLFWTAPQIAYSAHALIDFVQHMGWNYIGLVQQNSIYGWHADKQLKSMARNHSVCFSNTLKINKGTKAIVIQQMMTEFLITTKQSPVVVLALEEVELLEFLEAMKKLPEYLTKDVQLLSMTKWGTKLFITKGNEEIARGVITFQPQYKEEEDLSAYFKSKEFSSDKNVMNYTKSDCEGDLACLKRAFGNTVHSSTSAYSESVYAFVNALLLVNENNVSPKSFYSYIINKMTSLPNRDDVFPFRKDILDFRLNRRVQPRYGIYNFQKLSSGQYAYVQVGHWKYITPSSTNRHKWVNFKVNSSAIQWRPRGDQSSGRTPKSKCSEECKFNEIKMRDTRFEICCWMCEQCENNEIIKNGTCETCRQDEKPDKRLKRCLKLPHRQGQAPKELHGVVYSFTAYAFAQTLIGMFVFIYNRDTHIIRASSRELSTFIFIGLILWNSVPLFTITKITKLSCFLRTTFVYLGFSMVYAPLLLKTNRIYRIFQNGKVNPKPPKAVSPLSQVLITVCFCSVQITVCLVRITNLEIKQMFDTDLVVDYCADDIIVFSVNLVYILVIMALATFYAFKTRHFPKNYNESKYIGIAMYITLFISCMGLVTYFSISDRGFKSCIVSLVCLICSITVFLCLFPKRFYVLLKAGKPLESDSTNQQNRPKSDTLTIQTNIEREPSVGGASPPETPAIEAEPPGTPWDIRRFSSISMLSILRIQQKSEIKITNTRINIDKQHCSSVSQSLHCNT